MRTKYFKPRKFFDFSPHPYDIGNPVGFWHKYEDNHFLNKIYFINKVEFSEYYDYHLNYALSVTTCTEKQFFFRVWGIIEDRIKLLKAEDPYSRYHDRYMLRIDILQQFQQYLNGIDQWNSRPSDIILAEKQEVIQTQKNEIEKLKKRVNELEIYEVTQKIRIEENHLPVLADLIQQMRALELPSGRKLLKSDHKSPFYMMISKYFSDGGDDIPIQTARNYFKGNGEYIKTKSDSNNPKEHFFTILSVKQVKK